MMRQVLVLMPSLFFDPTLILVRARYERLSEVCSGEVWCVVSEGDRTRTTYGRFTIHGLYLPDWVSSRSWLRHVLYSAFVVFNALRLRHSGRMIDVVIARDAFSTGALAVLVRRILRARMIVEILGNYVRSYAIDRTVPGFLRLLKRALAIRLMPWVLKRADAVRLLYPGQLRDLGLRVPDSRAWYFHDFVPVSLFREGRGTRPYVLLLGGPWYLKGADVLIRAFQQIEPRFPGVILKIVGYTPDREAFERMAGSDPRIELHGPIRYDRVLTLMSECAVFVLPSRTEAMGSVLLEAMACKKPIVASRVDGIPTYIKDGFNGLLAEPGDVTDLSAKLERLLRDPEYAAELAENGFRYVHETLCERAYVNRFAGMLEQACRGCVVTHPSQRRRTAGLAE